MKKTKFYLFVLFCLSLFISGCERDSSLNDLPPSNLRSIVRLVLNPYQNAGNVTMKFTATIDESSKIITLKLPKNLVLDSIRPELVFSPWATLSPMNLEPIDLTKDTVEYTVTAESGKKAVYAVVKDMTYQFANNAIYSISFPEVFDAITGNPVRNTFWSAPYNLGLKVPVGTNKTAINTNLEMSGDSYNAAISVSEDGNGATFRPFSNPVNYSKKVIFRSVSEDGKKTTDFTITSLYN